MKRFFVIINSRMGQSRVHEIRAACQKLFVSGTYAVHETQYAGHSTVLAQEAVQNGYPVVVAAGGDGTVNEVMQVLVGSSCAMAIIPGGSGNGLARHCSIPLNAEKAVALIVEGHSVQLDTGSVNGRYFISNAGVGFDAIVCQAIRQTKSRGLAMYIRMVAKHFFTYRPQQYQIKTESLQIASPAYFLNAANGKQFGYGFEIASDASLTDGLLDLVIVKKMSFVKGVSLVWHGWRKTLHRDSNCVFLKARYIEISSPSMRYFQTDGDAFACEGQCIFRVHPLSLQLIVPISKSGSEL